MGWMNVVRVLSLVSLASCFPNVGPSNPFDPDVPVSQQARATLRGTIRDESGLPLTLAVVSVVGPTVPVNSPETTDDTGAFNFGELQPGTYTLQVKHPTHLRQIRDIILGVGETRDLPVDLETLPSVLRGDTGHLFGVVQKAGELALPVAAQDHSGIVVEIVGVGTRTTTNAEGRFDVYLSPGTYTVGLSAADYKAETLQNVLIVDATSTALNDSAIVLTANPGSIAGTVLLEGAADGAHTGTSVSLDGTSATATTDSSGAFTLSGVAAGTYTVRATKTGFDTQTITGVSVRGGVATTVEAVTLAISRGSIAGQVVLSPKADADYAGVTLSLTGTAFSTTSTTSGAYVFTAIPVGTYELVASSNDFGRKTVGSVTVTSAATSNVSAITLVQQSADFAVESAIGTDGPGYATGSAVQIVTLSPPVDGNTYTHFKVYGDVAALSSGTFDAYQPIPSLPFSLTLSGSDGAKTVRAKLSTADSGGTESAELSALITLDTLAPDGDFTIDSGATYTQDDTVNLGFSATDATSGVRYYRAWNASVAEPSVWQDYVAAVVHAVSSPLEEGSKTINVRYADAAGNATPIITHDVTLDLTNPAISAVTLNCPQAPVVAGYCNQPFVSLATTASDANGVAFQQIVNGTTFPFEDFRLFESPTTWSLSPGDGNKDVRVRVRDVAGRISSDGSASIIVDGTSPASAAVTLTGRPPLGISCTPAVGQSGNRTIDVTLGAVDSALERMRLSESSDFSSAQTVTFTTPCTTCTASTTFQLSDNDGVHTVYAEYRDSAGNVTVVSSNISLDRVAPSLASASVQEGTYVSSTTATVAINGSDATKMNVGGSDITNPSGWIDFAATRGVLLSSSQGLKSIPVQLRDGACNESSTQVATTTRDSVAPTSATLSVSAGNLNLTPVTGNATDAVCVAADRDWVRSQIVSVALTSADATSPIVDYQLSEDPAFNGTSWETWPASGRAPFILSGGDGDKTLYLNVRDAANNTRTSTGVCVKLDTTPPAALSLVHAPTTSPVGFINTPAAPGQRTFAVSAYDSMVGGSSLLRLDDGGGSGASIAEQAFVSPVVATISGGEGSKSLRLKVSDPAGNFDFVSTTLSVDTTPPSPPTLTFARSLNAAAQVSWTKSNSTDIASYEIDYAATDTRYTYADSGTTPAVYTHTGTTSVASSLTSTVVYDPVPGSGTTPPRQGAGLSNKATYQFRGYAVDNAGNRSAGSTPVSTVIGWTIKDVVSTGAFQLVPQSVVYKDGKIYVLYLESQASQGVPAAALKLAISSDGGNTFRIVAVPNSLVAPGRVSAALTVGRTALSVVSTRVNGTGPGAYVALVEYRSVDDGISWTSQDLVTDISFNAAPTEGYPLTVAQAGSSRTVVFKKKIGAAPSGNSHLYAMWSPDDSDTSWLNTDINLDNGNPFSSDDMLHQDVTEFTGAVLTRDIRRLSSCIANYTERLTWSQAVTPGTPRSMDSQFHGTRWVQGPTSPENPDAAAGAFATFSTVACAALNVIDWGYYFSVTTNGDVRFKARAGASNFTFASVLAPGSIASNSAFTIATGADPGSPVAAWAGADQLYAAYRDASSGNLVIMVGKHDATTTPVGMMWTKTTVDTSGDAGFNPVITGYGADSPIVAYTDITGSRIKIARASSLAPQGDADLTGLSARYGWSTPPDGSIFDVLTSAACSAPYSLSTTSSNIYTFGTATAQCIEATVHDDNDLSGDRGQQWQLRPFTDVTRTGIGAANEDYTSDLADISAVSGMVAYLDPRPTPGSPLRMYYSTDDGLTFTAQTVSSPGGTIGSRSLALRRVAANQFTAHVLYEEDTHLDYARGTFNGSTWSFASPVVDLPQEGGTDHHDKISIRSNGSEVVAAYRLLLAPDNPARVLYSSNDGVSWPDISGGGAPLSVSFPIGVGNTTFGVALGRARTSAGDATAVYRLGNNNVQSFRFFAPSAPPASPSFSSHCKTNASFAQPCADLTIAPVKDHALVAAHAKQFSFFGYVIAGTAVGAGFRLHVAGAETPPGNPADYLHTMRGFTLSSSADTTVVPNVADAVGADDGAFVSYVSCTNSGLAYTWKLNLAYCDRECFGAENWAVSVVQSATSSTGSCADDDANAFRSVALAYDDDPLKRRLYLSYQHGTVHHVLSGGLIRRVR
jgi:Carboxypeptidase regulatory-like domain